MRPHVPPMVREPPVVEKVLYGIGKFIDKNTPMAHSDRILTAVNRYIIPKLKPEQMAWVRKHKDAIETASVIAGVGITATEITLATVFTVRMVKRFRGALDRVRASRPVRPVDARRPEQGRKTLEGMAKERPKGKSIVPKKEIPVVYDRTNELLIIQEMAEDPKWETSTSRALAEGKLVLRANERVDWDRLGIPDPTKKVVHTSTNFFEPVDSYVHKPRPPAAVESNTPVVRGIGDIIRDRIEAIWPWSFQNTELAARRKKYAAQRALRERNIADKAKKAALEEQKRLLKQFGPMGPPNTERMRELNDAYERGVQEVRARTRALSNQAATGEGTMGALKSAYEQGVEAIRERTRAIAAAMEERERQITTGSVIDSALAKRNPSLVARLAEKMSVGDTSATRDIARIMVQIAEKPDAYQSMLQHVADAADERQALRAAAQLFQRAYNAQKGVKKITGEYSTKFTTLASVWLHRFGKEGLDLLLKK